MENSLVAVQKFGQSMKKLVGKVAIANAKIAHARYRDLYAGEQWKALAARGAKPQRLLWASTSTKNPKYSKTIYVGELIGPETVNTMPVETFAAEAILNEWRAGLARLREIVQSVV